MRGTVCALVTLLPLVSLGGTSEQGYYRLKQVKVIDQHGFEKPIPAMSLLIPTDWDFQGGVKYLAPGGCGMLQTTFRASGPDGRSIELLPEYNWQWSEDPTTVQYLSAQRGCDVMRPMSSADLLRRMAVPKLRPGARVAAVEPIPKLLKVVQDMAKQAERDSAKAGFRVNVRADLARARLQYTQGKGTEGWLTALIFTRAWPSPTFNPVTLQQGQAMYYSVWAQMFDLRAPSGQLDASEKLFEVIASSVRVDPTWQSRVTAVQNNIAAAQIKGAADRSAIISKSNAEISKTIVQGYQERSRSHDRAMANYSEALRGVQTYRNPNTGETFELSNQYGHAWINNRNEYILSDQEGFDPNVALKTGSWTRLEPAKH